MSSFGNVKFTNKGKRLQSKVQAGGQLKFTRMALGDGELAGSIAAELNALKNEKKSLSIAKLKSLNDGKAVIGAIFSNQNITTGFYWREIGIFALDPDEGEILYCYCNSGALAEYIPPFGPSDIIEKAIDLIVLTSETANVTAVIDSSLVYATQKEVGALASEINSLTDKVKLVENGVNSLITLFVSNIAPSLTKANDIWFKVL